METTQRTSITVEALINADINKVWSSWNDPDHITKWCHASDDWHAPYAENDLRNGGEFKTTMAARDGSMQFDFGGVYDDVVINKRIAYTMSDGRKVQINFSEVNGGVQVVETFDAESSHSTDMQRAGWQAILDNFKKFVEGK